MVIGSNTVGNESSDHSVQANLIFFIRVVIQILFFLFLHKKIFEG